MTRLDRDKRIGTLREPSRDDLVSRVVIGRGELLAVLEALFVTFLWSSSYVLTKVALVEVTPLLFAAIRYIMASLILVAVNLRSGGMNSLCPSKRDLPLVALAGILGYTVAQGFQIVGLSYLPATMVSLILNFTPVFVLLMEMVLLRESPAGVQVLGIGVAVTGAILYFSEHLTLVDSFGVLIVLLSGIGWAAYMIVVRRFQKSQAYSSLRLTSAMMCAGTLGLLGLALAFEPLRVPSASSILILVWLSTVNTALAFYLWSHALRVLRAYELSILQNSMLAQIAIMSFLFLGEAMTSMMIVGIILVLLGILLVQLRISKRARRES